MILILVLPPLFAPPFSLILVSASISPAVKEL